MLKSTLALAATATLLLDGPDGDPVGYHDETETDENGKPVFRQMAIELMRADSKEAQHFKNRAKNERLRKASRRGRLELTQEQLDEEALDLAVFCTKGWSHFIGEDDKPVPCNAKNVRDLYGNADYSWIYEQVDAFINRSANFAGNS